jgi:homoserine O-succinyltransferase
MPLLVSDVHGGVMWPHTPFPTFSKEPATSQERIELALINNMPDLAIEETESQFFQLLDDASCDYLVRLRLFSLPNLPRGEQARKRFDNYYFGINDLWNSRFDAAIVTGTEPRPSNLRQEPYWPALVDVLDWAEEETISAVLSCLAAHAAVLHTDGISRRPLEEKRCGVFDVERVAEHPLTAGVADNLRFPHSRWNEISADALAAAGYSVLTHSKGAGVDLFAKKKRVSLFLGFQGHPEYDALTLFKEYRRDTRRFLKGERTTYPSLPVGYFDNQMSEALHVFRERAVAQKCEELMAEFPDRQVARRLQNTWYGAGRSIYRSWLRYVAQCKSEHAWLASLRRMTPQTHVNMTPPAAAATMTSPRATVPLTEIG